MQLLHYYSRGNHVMIRVSTSQMKKNWKKVAMIKSIFFIRMYVCFVENRKRMKRTNKTSTNELVIETSSTLMTPLEIISIANWNICVAFRQIISSIFLEQRLEKSIITFEKFLFQTKQWIGNSKFIVMLWPWTLRKFSYSPFYQQSNFVIGEKTSFGFYKCL